jgi:steroid 5-alpha reductase family enzyme
MNWLAQNKPMKYFTPLIPFALGFALLLFIPAFSQLALFNAAGQFLLFVLVACIPAWKTGRMSYVDIAWPWGLVMIGVFTFLYSPGYDVRVWVVSGAYVFMGLRMGLGALQMWRKGWLKTEFPRYQYQRRRWQKSGKTNTALVMQVDVLLQALANASFLAFPAWVIAANPNPHISMFEWLGLCLWLLAFVMESLADAQKLQFLKRMKQAGKKNQLCDVGLWAYSRHPNYFAEWMVWNGLVIAAAASWYQLMPTQPTVLWSLVALGLVFVSRVMYSSLVYYTGAIPAEFYSKQKRPAYAEYQNRVNRLFPGPQK